MWLLDYAGAPAIGRCKLLNRIHSLVLASALLLLVPVELSFLETSGALRFSGSLGLFVYGRLLEPTPLLDYFGPWNVRALEMFGAFSVLLLFCFREAGMWRACFRTLALGSLAVLPLPVEIWFSSGSLPTGSPGGDVFNMHATNFFLPWLSNADLLKLAILCAVISSLALTSRGLAVGSSRWKAPLFVAFFVLSAVGLLGYFYVTRSLPPVPHIGRIMPT